MLDTNIVSHLIRQQPAVVRHVTAASMGSLCISAITAGELHFGLAKRPKETRLRLAVNEILRRMDVLPWDADVAKRYGDVRADIGSAGKTLAPLDCLTGAHALAAGAVLVTNDQAFRHVAGLDVEDWTH